jgi:hypothetical protein
MNTYVKTVYEDGQKPNITRYKSKELAENMITAYAGWGLGIVSCEAIPEEVALAQVRAKTVIYDRA